MRAAVPSCRVVQPGSWCTNTSARARSRSMTARCTFQSSDRPRRMGAGHASPPPRPPCTDTARIAEAGQRLSQFKAALAQGADPGVVSAWINEAQADLARARTDLALLSNEVPAELSHSDLTTVVTDMSALVSGLPTATPAAKADLYRDLGLRLTYHHDSGEGDGEVSTAQACAKRGVRGGTCTPVRS